MIVLFPEVLNTFTFVERFIATSKPETFFSTPKVTQSSQTLEWPDS
jgi:hypothetical protein